MMWGNTLLSKQSKTKTKTASMICALPEQTQIPIVTESDESTRIMGSRNQILPTFRSQPECGTKAVTLRLWQWETFKIYWSVTGFLCLQDCSYILFPKRKQTGSINRNTSIISYSLLLCIIKVTETEQISIITSSPGNAWVTPCGQLESFISTQLTV